jgi:hypothetical protein
MGCGATTIAPLPRATAMIITTMIMPMIVRDTIVRTTIVARVSPLQSPIVPMR